MIPEPSHQSGCATCTTARCCIALEPELTGFDLRRLVTARGLSPNQVARLSPGHTGLARADGILLDGPLRTWLLQLRTRPSDLRGDGRLPEGPRRCVFLAELAPGIERCGVYAHRPMLCRTFPTELLPFGVMVTTPESICPPDAWSVARTDLAGARRVHLRAAIERDLHRAFLARWNRGAEAREPLGRELAVDAFFTQLGATTEALEALLAPRWRDDPGLLATAAAFGVPADDGEALSGRLMGPTQVDQASEEALLAQARTLLDRVAQP